jgi:hypothetical protein
MTFGMVGREWREIYGEISVVRYGRVLTVSDEIAETQGVEDSRARHTGWKCIRITGNNSGFEDTTDTWFTSR